MFELVCETCERHKLIRSERTQASYPRPETSPTVATTTTSGEGPQSPKREDHPKKDEQAKREKEKDKTKKHVPATHHHQSPPVFSKKDLAGHMSGGGMDARGGMRIAQPAGKA